MKVKHTSKNNCDEENRANLQFFASLLYLFNAAEEGYTKMEKKKKEKPRGRTFDQIFTYQTKISE